MQAETVIIINGEKSLRQLSNALVRVGIKPKITVAEMEAKLKKSSYDHCFVIPIEFEGISNTLFVRMRSYSDVNLAYSSRFKSNEIILKDLNQKMFILSLNSNQRSMSMLTKIAVELGGGYILPNDNLKASDGIDGNFHKIKGKI